MVRVQDPPPPFSIAALAAAGGVGVETVRFYQRLALLPVPARRPGARRRYGPEALGRLRFIRQAQAAGFTLREVAELIRLDAEQDRARALEMARTRLADLDERVRELLRARRGLRRLAAECAGGGSGPCPILSAFGG